MYANSYGSGEIAHFCVRTQPHLSLCHLPNWYMVSSLVSPLCYTSLYHFIDSLGTMFMDCNSWKSSLQAYSNPCMRTAKALVRLSNCTVSPESLLFAFVINGQLNYLFPYFIISLQGKLLHCIHRLKFLEKQFTEVCQLVYENSKGFDETVHICKCTVCAVSPEPLMFAYVINDQLIYLFPAILHYISSVIVLAQCS